MNSRLTELLDRLATTLTPERESAIESLHRRSLDWEPVERLPLILTYPVPAGRFEAYPHAEALADPEKMLFNELVSAFGTSLCHRESVGDDLPATIRANFGTGLVASLFGAQIEQTSDNPPWVRPFPTRAGCAAALDRDPLDFTQGWVPRTVECYEFFHATLAGWPELARVVKCVLPDLQGPLDTLELLRGSEVFLDLVEDPEAVDRALERLSTAQIGLARRLARYVSEGQAGGWSHQHGFAIRGHILLRVDTTIMLSPQMYRQQVRPHDERVLGEMGGGGLHSCGKISHLAAEFMSARGCQCLDVGQPHLNDLDRLYALARERRIPRLRLSVAEAELRSGRVLDRFPTGVSLSHAADSIEDARGIMADYQAAARRRRDSAKTPKDL